MVYDFDDAGPADPGGGAAPVGCARNGGPVAQGAGGPAVLDLAGQEGQRAHPVGEGAQARVVLADDHHRVALEAGVDQINHIDALLEADGADAEHGADVDEPQAADLHEVLDQVGARAQEHRAGDGAAQRDITRI